MKVIMMRIGTGKPKERILSIEGKLYVKPLETFAFSVTNVLLPLAILAYALPKERYRDRVKGVLLCANLLHGAKAIQFQFVNGQYLENSVIASTRQKRVESLI